MVKLQPRFVDAVEEAVLVLAVGLREPLGAEILYPSRSNAHTTRRRTHRAVVHNSLSSCSRRRSWRYRRFRSSERASTAAESSSVPSSDQSLRRAGPEPLSPEDAAAAAVWGGQGVRYGRKAQTQNVEGTRGTTQQHNYALARAARRRYAWPSVRGGTAPSRSAQMKEK